MGLGDHGGHGEDVRKMRTVPTEPDQTTAHLVPSELHMALAMRRATHRAALPASKTWRSSVAPAWPVTGSSPRVLASHGKPARRLTQG